MTVDRRQLLRAAGLAAAGGIAGCSGTTDSNDQTSANGTQDGEETGTPSSNADDGGGASVSASAAVAAEWTAMRGRIDDAFALGLAGHASAGATVGQDVFARFERAEGEYGAHEYLEDTNEANYEGFEGGLETLNEELQAGNVEAARDGWRKAHTHLREATVARVGEQAANAFGTLRIGAAVNDVELLAAAGDTDGAATVAEEVFGWFESAPAHDAIESADSEAYESLEGAMETAKSGAQSGDLAALRSATDAGASAAASGAYTIAASEELAGAGQLAAYQAQGWDAAVLASTSDDGGVESGALATIAQDVFAAFENARVHEMLEESSQSAYEGYESALDEYITALGGDGDVRAAATAYADATLRAQFAVVGAIDEAPVGEGSDGESDDSTDQDLEGGPDVVSGVPDDADHVVDVQAVAFSPSELTISAGDTVAFAHRAGEAHTVTAYADEIPDGATYWASGGFDSQSAAVEGWEHGKGVVGSGNAYVHTFETAGTHAYFCIPHEAAGMTGKIVVEK